jgi:hypothetical protein
MGFCENGNDLWVSQTDRERALFKTVNVSYLLFVVEDDKTTNMKQCYDDTGKVKTRVNLR